MKKFGNLSEMWDAFRAFKKQVPSKDYDKVLEELDEFKASVDDLYYVDKYKDENKRKMEEEVAKILNVKRNLVTNNKEILGWKMPSSFIPYIEKGENPEMLPKRLFEAYTAMLDSSEFAMLCDSNIQFMKEYDQFLIDWCSKCYGLDRRIVENNMTNTVEYIYNQAKLVVAL